MLTALQASFSTVVRGRTAHKRGNQRSLPQATAAHPPADQTNRTLTLGRTVYARRCHSHDTATSFDGPALPARVCRTAHPATQHRPVGRWLCARCARRLLLGPRLWNRCWAYPVRRPVHHRDARNRVHSNRPQFRGTATGEGQEGQIASGTGGRWTRTRHLQVKFLYSGEGAACQRVRRFVASPALTVGLRDYYQIVSYAALAEMQHRLLSKNPRLPQAPMSRPSVVWLEHTEPTHTANPPRATDRRGAAGCSRSHQTTWDTCGHRTVGLRWPRRWCRAGWLSLSLTWSLVRITIELVSIANAYDNVNLTQ